MVLETVVAEILKLVITVFKTLPKIGPTSFMLAILGLTNKIQGHMDVDVAFTWEF